MTIFERQLEKEAKPLADWKTKTKEPREAKKRKKENRIKSKRAKRKEHNN